MGDCAAGVRGSEREADRRPGTDGGRRRQGNAITATALATTAEAGDPLARTLVAEIEDALVAGLGSITNGLNPAVLILGGGVIEALPQLIEAARQRLILEALPVSAAAVRVECAMLGGDAGAVGAAARARAPT